MRWPRLFISIVQLFLSGGPAVAGDWPTFAGSPQRLNYVGDETVLTAATVGKLRLHWSTSLHATTVTQALFLRQVRTATNGTHAELFQAMQNGTVTALNAVTGAVDWSVRLPTGKPACATSVLGIGGTPTIDPVSRILYVVDGIGGLHALRAGTGAELHGYPVQMIDPTDVANGSFNHSSPTRVGATLYITTSGAGGCEDILSPYHGAVIALSTRTRKVTGSFLAVPGPAGGGGIWGPGGAMEDPASGLLYVGTGNALAKPSYQADGEAVVELDPDLNRRDAHSPGPDVFRPRGDLDFGSTPTPVDAADCPPLLAIMNKSGKLFVLPRGNLAAGPTQVLDVSTGDGKSAFIGMAAYDPAQQMLFIDNPVSSRDGAVTHGAVALLIKSPACRLTLAWQAMFGTGIYSPHTRATDPVVAGGVVWIVTGDGKSVLALNEASGTLLWSSGATLSGAMVWPVTVADGQMFIQSGLTMYAFGL